MVDVEKDKLTDLPPLSYSTTQPHRQPNFHTSLPQSPITLKQILKLALWRPSLGLNLGAIGLKSKKACKLDSKTATAVEDERSLIFSDAR